MKIPTQIWIFCVGIFLQHYTFLQKRTFCILCENFSRFVRKATVDIRAEKIFQQLVKSLAEKENVTESLKAKDMMLWVQKMNNIRNRASEIVNTEVIFV